MTQRLDGVSMLAAPVVASVHSSAGSRAADDGIAPVSGDISALHASRLVMAPTRSSPRLAQKVRRSDRALSSLGSAAAAAASDADAAAGATPDSGDAAASIHTADVSMTPTVLAAAAAAAADVPTPTGAHSPALLSRPSSTCSSPTLTALEMHTPSKRSASGSTATRQRVQPPCAHTPSPMSLPPPVNARRKIFGGGTAGTSSGALIPCGPAATNHTAASNPLSSRRAASPTSMSTSGAMECDLPTHDSLMRSASCPTRESYHKLNLPCHQADGVNFITPRIAAMLLMAQEKKRAMMNGADAAAAATEDIPFAPGLTPPEEALIDEWAAFYDRVHILDARFPYEYDGGHIRGAVNITSHSEAEDMFLRDIIAGNTMTMTTRMTRTQTQPTLPSMHAAALMSDSAATAPSSPCRSSPPSVGRVGRVGRVCILIHCEFSRHRGPKCFKFLRKRDREVMGIEHFPQLHYPELYVIQGGYQSFFAQHGGVASCQPNEYVPMLDQRFKKEYHVHWKRMRRSSSITTVAIATSIGGGGAVARGAMSPCASTHNGGDGGSGGKPPAAVMGRRASRTRSWTEMDSPCGPLAGTSVFNSPALLSRSLQGPPSLLFTPGSGAATTAPTATSPSPIPSHPRVSRGLSTMLDSSATGGAAGTAMSLRRTASAFSFHTQSQSSTSSASHTHPHTHPQFGFGGMPLSSGSVSGMPSPRLTPTSAFFASNTAAAGSPSPSYGWSLEGRTSTPSPFQAESPRITPSPVPLWNSPSTSAAFGGGHHAPTPLHMYGYGFGSSSARATPLSMGDESPRSGTRSRSGSTVGANPPVFTNAKNPAAACLDVFASPTHRSARNLAARAYSQSHSPSSALHNMQLRSSPSGSVSVSRSTCSSVYSPSPSTVEGHAQHQHSDASSASASPSPALAAIELDLALLAHAQAQTQPPFAQPVPMTPSSAQVAGAAKVPTAAQNLSKKMRFTRSDSAAAAQSELPAGIHPPPALRTAPPQETMDD